jgi:hypothetical protein
VPKHAADRHQIGRARRRQKLHRHRRGDTAQRVGHVSACPRGGHHRDIGQCRDRPAVDHVAQRDVGRIPRQSQPHFVGIEDVGDDAELGNERGRRDELRHDVRAGLGLRGC